MKVNLGKYLEAASNGVGYYSTTNPISRLTTTSGLRAWTDANRNFIPDCDLLNMSPNLECGQGNATFGKEVFTTNVDPNALGGWGVRPSDWGSWPPFNSRCCRGCRSRSATRGAGSITSP